MDELTAVTGAVDCLVSGALAPLIELLANDVEFEVASGGDAPGCRKSSGRQVVADYFDALGDLPAFWRMDEFSATDGRVIAWGDESFTLEGCGLEVDLDLVLGLDAGLQHVELQLADHAHDVIATDHAAEHLGHALLGKILQRALELL